MFMPMGLMNGGATFQAMMEEILAPHLWTTVVVYLDDVFIYSESVDEHIQHVDEVMTLLEEAGLRTRPDKTELCKESIKVLGHLLTKEGLRPLPNKVKNLCEEVVDKSKKGIMRFLGLARYYERFIPELAKITKPLTSMLKKDVDVKANGVRSRMKLSED